VSSPAVAKGFWGSLSSLSSKVSSHFSGIWRRLGELAGMPAGGAHNLYGVLRGKASFSSYKPRLRADIQEFSMTSAREGSYHILKNPSLHKYLKITEEEHSIVVLMDGTKTVEELVVAYFMSYHILAQDRIAGLVRQMWSDSFLMDRPPALFGNLRAKLEEGTLPARARRLQNLFFNHQVSLGGIDGMVTWLYRHFFCIFFSKPLILLYPLISLIGLFCFVRLLKDSHYPLFTTGSSYSLGALTLMGIAVFRISLHEGAHAFATKSCGREIPRGGFLFYLGIPSFFADTTDIWLGSRKERIAVSWAGPYAEIILSSLLSIMIVLWPHHPANGLFFKVAFVGYLSAFLNLNPLLELDGYFMLMDLLEIPQLRKLSMGFISEKLFGKLARREALCGREKIFALFGSLSLLWTGAAIVISLLLLKVRMMATIRDMLHSDEILARFMALVTFLFFVAPLLISLLAMAYVGGRKAFAFLSRCAILKEQRFQVPLFIGLSLAFAFWGERAIFGFPFSIALSLLDCALILLILRELSGSSLIDEYAMKLAALLSLLCCAIPGGFSNSVGIPYSAQIALSLAFIFFFIYAFRYFLNFDMSLYSAPERFRIFMSLLSVALIMTALEGLAWAHNGALYPAVSPLWMGAVTLTVALLVPMIFNFAGTALILPLVMEALALMMLLFFATGAVPGCMGMSRSFFGLLALSLFLGSSLLFLWAYRGRRVTRRGPSMVKAASPRDKLFDVFRVLTGSLLATFRSVFGERPLRHLVKEFNGHSRAEGWDVIIENMVPVDHAPECLLPELATRCKKALELMRGLIMETSGSAMVHDDFVHAYDDLYWEERELANEHLLSDLEWARGILRIPPFREEVVSFLRMGTILGALPDEELKELVPLLRVRNFSAGDTIVLQGEPGDAFYLIRQGRAQVLVRDDHGREKMVATLRRGDSFGERALLEKSRRTATVKALTALEALFIGRRDFDRLLGDRQDLLKRISDAYEMESLMRNLPLLGELSHLELQVLYSRMETRRCAPGEVIIRQGDGGEEFFIIKKGEFGVTVACGDAGESEKAPMKEGDYFGEIALIRDIPRTATVTSLTGGELLVLNKSDFQELLREYDTLVKSLEETSQRRVSAGMMKRHGGKLRAM
jgi:putative peptide zinc metalloprotease protein